ncbi:MAG: hypothetical protein E7080_06505 [Bacteroidales bacterium]|nr:hypothetical protein [Bacteroidales bacterium]
MENLRKILYAMLVGVVMMTTACIEDDFTTSSSDVLEFSCDTLAFDTVFTELGTPTKRFTVYNRHKKMINISSVKFEGTNGGRFYLNVDGMTGEEFHDVEIRGEDSIFVFVEAYIDPTNKNNPIEIKDNVQFVTNGVTQRVLVTAWGQDVVRKYGEVVESDARLTAEKPYVIFDSLVVAEGATLTIEPGATLCFHDDAYIDVRGTLNAIGTQYAPITLRGDRTDNVVGDIDFDIMSGQWGGVYFAPESFDNEIQYVLMRGSTFGVYADSCGVMDRRKLHLYNSVLHNATNAVLLSMHSWIDAEGTEFSDAGGNVVALIGGKVRFVNCTLANYYLFSAIGGAILGLDYVLPEDEVKDVPLMDARFDNCVIYGIAGDINIGDLTNSNVYLRNCLLKSAGENDDNFINCVWEGDPMFFTIREDYIFDYRLKNESQAIGKGDASLCPQEAAIDRYGVNRFERDSLDIGAYVWVEQIEEEKK